MATKMLMSCLMVSMIIAVAAVNENPEHEWWTWNTVRADISAFPASIPAKCECINYNCGCCAHVEADRINLNDTVCINITYLVNDYGLSFTISIDDRIIYNTTVSARNPPPVCISVPYLHDLAHLCVQFYDLNIEAHKLHGCVKLEAKLGPKEIGKYELGCFDINFLAKNMSTHIDAK